MALNTRRVEESVWAPPPGEVTTLVAVTAGTWPAGTRLLVGDPPDTPATATVLGSSVVSADGLTATWALSEADCAILRTHTRFMVQAPSGAAWEGILAGPVNLEPAWSGGRAVQRLGTVMVGPQGPAGTVADATSSVKGVVALTGDLGGTAAAPTVPGLAGLAYSLTRAGLGDATTNITTLISGAVAAGRRHIVIPYRATPWPMTTQLTATDVTIEFEPGARVSLNMATGLAMDLTRCTLVNASFTSPFTGPITTGNHASYALPARGLLFRDDCRTEGDYYHEYATTGIQVIGARCRIMGDATFTGMRHRTGWAEAIHVDGGLGGVYDFVCHGQVTVTDSDRAIEVEEGVYDITFLGGGRFTDVYPNGYTGQPVDATGPDGEAYATYTFTIGVHSHTGGGGSRNVRYHGHWEMTDCGSGVSFIRSSGTNDSDMPRDCYVESVTIRGLALAPGYQAVALQGYNNRVDRVHFTTGSGIAGVLFRVRGYGGSGNVVKTVTADSATKNLIRVDNNEGGGLRAGELTMPVLKSATGKYVALSGPVNATNGALGNNTLRLVPHYVATPMCIDRIGCEVTVVGQAGCVVRLGIYDDAGGLPGNPIIDATVPGDAVATPEAVVFTVLAPGWYWVGGAIQGAATTQPTLRSTGSQATPGMPILADNAATAVQSSPIAHSKGGVTGALPAFGTTLSGTSAAPRVFVRLV